MGKSIGIDLGTTNSAAAIEDGRVKVLPTRMNEPLTPSVVSYRQARRAGRQGIILVGRAAINNAVNDPEQTIFSIKRLMGRTIDDPNVNDVRDRFPYTVTQADDPDDRGVRVVLNDVKYSPVDVSAMILRQIVEEAELALGADVTHAVITVPAYFSEAQRAATRAAGDQAGLIVKKMIDEPTAAAIAFGIDRAGERHRVLVFDLGGGTFDISIIQMVNEQYQVLAIEGDMWLGGDDFDREIAQEIGKWVQKEYDGLDPTSDRRFLMLAKQQAEKAKIALSGQPDVDISIPAATRTSGGDLVDVDMLLTRERFEEMIQPYVDRSITLVHRALNDQHLGPDDISAVLLVGGSTAIPLVYEAVAKVFGKEKVRRDVDPMQCVALGAGILAARLQGVECPQCRTLNVEDARECMNCKTALASARSVGGIGLGEVTARSLGISAVGKDGKPGYFSVIIPKGTQYPLARPQEKIFYVTSENLVRVPVYEGDDPIAARNERQGEIEYNLPQAVPPNTQATVSFNYDKDRVLTVGIRIHGYPDLKTDKVLTRNRSLGESDLQDDKWRQDLEGTTNTAEYFLEQYQDYLEPGTVAKVRDDVQRARRAFAEGNKVVGVQITEALRMAILGSGIASQMFLAERVMEGEPPQVTQRMQQAIRELKDARRRKDQRREQEIAMALQMAVVRIVQERAGQPAVESRDYDGLLRESLF